MRRIVRGMITVSLQGTLAAQDTKSSLRSRMVLHYLNSPSCHWREQNEGKRLSAERGHHGSNSGHLALKGIEACVPNRTCFNDLQHHVLLGLTVIRKTHLVGFFCLCVELGKEVNRRRSVTGNVAKYWTAHYEQGRSSRHSQKASPKHARGQWGTSKPRSLSRWEAATSPGQANEIENYKM